MPLEARLPEGEGLYRDLVEGASDLIQSVGPDGRFLFVNRAWREALGYSSEEVAELTFLDVVEPAHHDECRRLLEDALSGHELKGVVVTFVARDDRRVVLEGNISARLEAGLGVATCGIFRDISRRREVDEMRERFVATISHELRTPITSIRGALSLLTGGALGELPAKAREMLVVAERNSTRLATLINNLLDWSRFAKGPVEVKRVPVRLAAIFRDAVEAVETLAEQRRVTLAVDAPPLSVLGDAERLVHAVVNLLSNAVKFSPQGGTAALSARLAGDFVEISVSDEGPGLSPERMARLLEGAADDVVEPAAGPRIGLPVLKRIVESHGGTVGVESEPGRGSRLWFRVPAAAVAPVAPAPERLTVLVCDDEPSVRRYLALVLDRAGFDVVDASSASEALAILSEREVTAVLIDLVLPGGTGLDLLDELRRNPATESLPAVLLSGRETIAAGDLARRGAVFLPKPISPESVVAALHRVLSGRTAGDVLAVDSDASLLDVLSQQLSRDGFAVRTATGGTEALRALRFRRPALLVLDVDLPDGNGFDLVSILRADPRFRSLPLLVFTARDLADEERSRLTLGPTRFVTKSKSSVAEFRRHAGELFGAAAAETSAGALSSASGPFPAL